MIGLPAFRTQEVDALGQVADGAPVGGGGLRQSSCHEFQFRHARPLILPDQGESMIEVADNVKDTIRQISGCSLLQQQAP